MTKTEEYAEFLGKTAYYATLIVTCSYLGATVARAVESPIGAIVEAQVKVPNLIIEPDYETPKTVDDEAEDADVQPEELQYEPVTDELPLLENRMGMAGEKGGSHYEEGTELYVTPEPGITPKDEAIEESTPESVEVTPAPKGAF